MFCPKCGSILMPKKSGNKVVLGCSCGYLEKDTKKAEMKEEIKKKEEINVIEEEQEAYPLTDAKCPKCKHEKAYYWTVQTRSSDEPETKFLKCEKCKHIWRDYS